MTRHLRVFVHNQTLVHRLHRRASVKEVAYRFYPLSAVKYACKRLVAQELRLSFVPDAEQRLWDGKVEKVSVDARPRAATEPSGVSAGGSPYQVVQPSFGSAGRQFPAHVEGAR